MNYRKATLLMAIALIYVVVLSAYVLRMEPTKEKIQSINSISSGFALIELFTSEGCSSCPSADELLSAIDKDENYKNKQVYTLAFHVDYWNHLGWKDSLSSSAYSKRQKDYDDALNAETYTPQMIVNGKYAFVGSDKNDASKYIKQALTENPDAGISITNMKTEGDKIKIDYTLTGNYKGCSLNAVLAEDNIVHNIKRGENTGKVLHHNGVVRQFSSSTLTTAHTGGLFLKTEGLKNPANAKIIVFLEDTHTLAIKAVISKKYPDHN